MGENRHIRKVIYHMIKTSTAYFSFLNLFLKQLVFTSEKVKNSSSKKS